LHQEVLRQGVLEKLPPGEAQSRPAKTIRQPWLAARRAKRRKGHSEGDPTSEASKTAKDDEAVKSSILKPAILAAGAPGLEFVLRRYQLRFGTYCQYALEMVYFACP
jgi:hypothetical protein